MEVNIPDWLRARPTTRPRLPVVSQLQILPFKEISWEDFERLCLMLAREEGDVLTCRLYGERGEDQQGIDLYARSLATGKYRVYQCKREKDFGPTKIRKAVDLFLKGDWVNKAEALVLCTSVSMRSTARTEAIEKASRVLGERGVVFEVWDEDELSTRLKKLPDVVRAFFGPGWPEAFCPRQMALLPGGLAVLERYSTDNLSELRSAIVGGPLAGTIADKGIAHPALPDCIQGRRLLVSGGPGTGKSFFAYQACATVPNADVALLSTLSRELCPREVEQLLAGSTGETILVIDNLHEHLGAGNSIDGLGPALAVAGGHSPPATVLVTCWSSRRTEIDRAISATDWARWGFEELCIDDPPREFIVDVVNDACRRLAIDADEHILDMFVDGITRDWENTPACAVAALQPYEGQVLRITRGLFPIALQDRETPWRLLFADLQSRAGPEETVILRTMSVLRKCGFAEPSVHVVREVANKVGEVPGSAFDHAIERLQRERWIQRRRATLRCHDVQVLPETVGLHDSGQPSLFMDRFADAVTADLLPTLLAARNDILHGLGVLYWQSGLPERCIEFTSLILEREPDDIRALCNRGVARARIGELELGIADLSAAASLGPAEVEPTRTLFFTCLRYHRMGDAYGALRGLEKRDGAEPRVFRFLAQSYADLRKSEDALRCARNLAEQSPDDPESFSVLAEVLWMAGSNHREDAATILTKALEQWPDDARLLAVKAHFEYSEQNLERALELATEALRLQPNEPRNHASVAWFQFFRHQGDEQGTIYLDQAEATTERGLTLFHSWPDLLAIKGLILELKGHLEPARVSLEEAIERVERLGLWARLRVPVCLGKIALRQGRREEAEEWFRVAEKEGVLKSTVLQQKAHALRLAGMFKEARETLEEAARASDDSIGYWIALADWCSDDNLADKAIEALRSAETVEPENPVVAAMLASLLHKAEMWAQAVEAWKKSIACESPDPKTAWQLLGNCLAMLGRHEEALTAYEQAIVEGGGTTDLKIHMADTLRVAGKNDEALALCRQVEDTLERPNTILSFIKAKCHFARSEVAAAREAADRALDSAIGPPGEARSADDVSSQEIRGLVELLDDLDHPEGILRVLNHVRETGMPVELPQDALYSCAGLLERQSRPEEAEQLLDYCYGRFGPTPEVLHSMARFSWRAGRVEEAASRYEELVSHSHQTPTLAAERGKVLLQLDRTEDAERVLKEGLELDPDSQECTATLAELLATRKKWEEAGELLRGHRLRTSDESRRLIDLEVLSWYSVGDHEKLLEAGELALALPGAHPRISAMYGAAVYFVIEGFERAADLFSQLPFDELDLQGRMLLLSSSDICGRHDEAVQYARRVLPITKAEFPAVMFPLLKNGTDTDVATVVEFLREAHQADWNFVNEVMGLAAFLEAAERPDATTRLFQAAVDAAPDFHPLREILFVRFVQTEEWDRALQVIDHAGASARITVAFQQLCEPMAALCEGLGIVEEFLSNPSDILKAFPPCEVLAAATAVRLGRYDKGIEWFVSTIGGENWSAPGGINLLCPRPSDLPHLQAAAELWLSVHPTHPAELAVRYLLAAIRKAPARETEEILRVALERHPDKARVLESLCHLLNVTGRMEEALELADRAIDLGDPTAAPWEAKALALTSLNRPQEALSVIEDGLQRNEAEESKAALHGWRAVALDCLGYEREVESARSLCRQVLEDVALARAHERLNPLAICAESRALATAGEYERAHEACLAGLSRFPDSLEIIWALAPILQVLGKHEEILEIPLHEAALRCSPHSATCPTWWTVAYGWARTQHDLTDNPKAFRVQLRRLEEIFETADREFLTLAGTGLGQLGEAAIECGLSNEGLSVLDDLSERWHRIPHFWFVQAHLAFDAGLVDRCRTAIDTLICGRSILEVLESAGQASSTAEILLGDRILMGSLPFVAELSLREGRWLEAIAVLAAISRSIVESAHWAAWSLQCATAIANTPERSELLPDVARVVVGACLAVDQLADPSIQAVASGIEKLPLEDAAKCASVEVDRAAALATLLSTSELASCGAFGHLSAHREAAHQTFVKLARNSEDPLVSLLLRRHIDSGESPAK